MLERLSMAARIINAIAIAAVAGATIAERAHIVYSSAAVALLATLFLLYADQASATTLAQARSALDKAIEQQAELDTLRRQTTVAEELYKTEIERLSYFQAARESIRDIFEDVAEYSPIPQNELTVREIHVLYMMLGQTRWQLFLALGFAPTDYQTVCIYQRVIEDGKAVLVLRAHARAVECNVEKARKWAEGVGVPGSALALKREVVVADLTSPEAVAMYGFPNKKATDNLRYRSAVAEPISGLDGELWGVLVATSRYPGHFSQNDREYVNVVHSLAGMLSLAVKLVRSRSAISSRS